MIRKNSELKKVFPEGPMVAHRQPPNLRKSICRAKLYPVSSIRPIRISRTSPGWRPCAGNTGQCPVCPYVMGPTSEIVGLASGYRHKITDIINCQDENIIYYWRCTKLNCKAYPKCEYIGRSIRSFQSRFSQHRDYIKRNVLTEVAGEHFSTGGHSVSDLSGCAIERVKSRDPYVLKTREHYYIRKFNTYQAGLNRER